VQSPTTDDGWRSAAFPSSSASALNAGMQNNPSDLYNLPPFLDLHYFGAGSAAGMGNMHNGGIHPSLVGGNAGSSNGDELAYGNVDGSFGGAFGTTGNLHAQALDLAATNFWSGKAGLYSQYGSGQVHQASTTPTPGGWLTHGLPQQQPHPHHLVQQQQQHQQEMANSSIFKQNVNGIQGLGRSHSHHRGQSAQVSVNPQELMMGEHDGVAASRRKRASWDGRQV
jgi:hypothetical protein